MTAVDAELVPLEHVELADVVPVCTIDALPKESGRVVTTVGSEFVCVAQVDALALAPVPYAAATWLGELCPKLGELTPGNAANSKNRDERLIDKGKCERSKLYLIDDTVCRCS